MKPFVTFLLIICNVSLLSAQENTPTFTAYTSIKAPSGNTYPVSSAPAAKKSATLKKGYFRLGEKVVALAQYRTPDEQPYVLISLHNNEFTASEAAKKSISEQGGTYLELLNNNEKNIAFNLFDKNMIVDPNKIFTPGGRWTGLAANLRIDHIISQQLAELAKFILDEIPSSKTIISLHNNRADEFSLSSFKRGGNLFNTVQSLYENTSLDENDFIITSDKALYETLKGQFFNVVLQTTQLRDDGSLGIYCSKTKRPYISIETKNGHVDEQQRMIVAVTNALK